MTNYWNDLNLSQKWNKKERFNYILNCVDELTSSQENKETPVEEVENASVHVSVSDSKNNPVKDATVTLTKDNEVYTQTTGDNGECTIQNVSLGHYTVVTSKEGYIDDEDDITVVKGVNELEITLSEETGNIKITVVDENEDPVANANVKVYLTIDESYESTTGRAGGCTIRDVPFGEYTLEVTAEGFETTTETLTVNANDMSEELVLQREVDD